MFAGPAMFHHARSFQLGQMTGNSGLAHAQDLLQFGDGQFGFVEQEKQAEPGGIGQ